MGKQFGVFLAEADYDLVLEAILSVPGAVLIEERPLTCAVERISFKEWMSIDRPLGLMRILIAHEDLLDQVTFKPSGPNGQPICDLIESAVIEFNLCIQRSGAIEAGRFYRQDSIYDSEGDRIYRPAVFIKMADRIYKGTKRVLNPLADKYYYAGQAANKCRREGIRFLAYHGGSEVV